MSKSRRPLSIAREALASLVSFDELMAKLSPKDRLNVERHLTASEAESDSRHAKLWRRLAVALTTLSPHAAKTTGQTMQFYIADGKYRMQVFAIEDLRDGKITIYAGNALQEAISAGLLAGKPTEGETPYGIVGSSETLVIEALDGRTANPGPLFKDMIGWNRKALRIVLPNTASDAQATAVESLCALAAQRWLKPDATRAAGAKSA